MRPRVRHQEMTALRWEQKRSTTLGHARPVGVRTSSALTPTFPPSSLAEPSRALGGGGWRNPRAARPSSPGDLDVRGRAPRQRGVPACPEPEGQSGGAWPGGPASQQGSEQGTPRGQTDHLGGEGKGQGCFTLRPLPQARHRRRVLVAFCTHTALPGRSPRPQLSLLSFIGLLRRAAALAPFLSHFPRELFGEQPPSPRPCWSVFGALPSCCSQDSTSTPSASYGPGF